MEIGIFTPESIMLPGGKTYREMLRALLEELLHYWNDHFGKFISSQDKIDFIYKMESYRDALEKYDVQFPSNLHQFKNALHSCIDSIRTGAYTDQSKLDFLLKINDIYLHLADPAIEVTYTQC